MEISACEECGGIFERKRKDSRCCSPLCHQRSRRKRLDVREDARRRAKTYNSRPEVKERRWLTYKPAAVRFAPCKGCGKDFQVRTAGLYCSPSCRIKHYKKIKPEMFRALYEKHRTKMNAHMLVRYYKTRLNAPWRILLSSAKVRAKKRNVPFSISAEWCETRWTGHCELTGLPFDLEARGRNAMSPSIDQIRAGKGYTPNNTRFVLWAINAAKGSDSDETLYRIAEALISRVSRKDLSPAPDEHNSNTLKFDGQTPPCKNEPNSNFESP